MNHSTEVATWLYWRDPRGLWTMGRKTEKSFTPKGCELKEELTGTWDEAEKRFKVLTERESAAAFAAAGNGGTT